MPPPSAAFSAPLLGHSSPQQLESAVAKRAIILPTSQRPGAGWLGNLRADLGEGGVGGLQRPGGNPCQLFHLAESTPRRWHRCPSDPRLPSASGSGFGVGLGPSPMLCFLAPLILHLSWPPPVLDSHLDGAAHTWEATSVPILYGWTAEAKSGQQSPRT